MKFAINQRDLRQALTAAARVSNGKEAWQSTANRARLVVAEGVLTVTATDMSAALIQRTPVEAAEDGAVIVPLLTLAPYVAALADGRIDVVTRGSKLTLTSRGNRSSFVTVSDDDWPEIGQAEGAGGLSLSRAALREAVALVSVAVAKTDVRPVLAYMRWSVEKGALSLAGANSFVLTVERLPAETPPEPWEALLPLAGMRELLRQLAQSDEKTVAIGQTAQTVTFTLGGVRLALTRGNHVYPDFARLIPIQHQTRITVDAATLLAEVERLEIVGRDASYTLHLTTSDGLLCLGAQALEATSEAESEVAATVEGGPGRVAVDSRYLRDALRGRTGTVWIDLQGPTMPVVVRPVEGDGLTVIMPMFVQQW